MLGWLFKRQPEIELSYFSNLEIGNKFTKRNCTDKTTYVKKDEDAYETIPNGVNCIKWYIVHEDFIVNKEVSCL